MIIKIQTVKIFDVPFTTDGGKNYDSNVIVVNGTNGDIAYLQDIDMDVHVKNGDIIICSDDGDSFDAIKTIDDLDIIDDGFGSAKNATDYIKSLLLLK